MQSYAEFLDLSVGFPQGGFELFDDELYFNDLNLMEMIETYGTPLKFTYLPSISKNIQQAKLWFQQAIINNNYRGKYTYCYCTKSSHFRHVLEEALKNDIQLETSSAFDMPIIDHLEKKGLVSKDVMVICNGFKREAYKQYIVDMIRDGFNNIIPVLDNKEEFNFYDDELADKEVKIGIRIASEEQPDSPFYTSRLGIREDDIVDFYTNRLSRHNNFKLKLLHFFINSGISDTPYYWNELEKHVTTYCKLKKVCPDLTMLDIGGGMPFKTSLSFNFDYEYMCGEIVKRIKEICDEHEVEEPDLITEFGKYTVAEASGILFKVIGRKQQNDREKWLMLDGSFITNLPDVWALNQRYITLPINNWENEYEKVYLGGITCDGQDYYSEEANENAIYMPKTRKVQYVGFFHTGAYQESLSGYGGIHHCLLPTPKHVLIRRNRDETFNFEVFGEEQNSKQALKLLGYS
ncbi:MAG TPA: arginine decarboxylase [Luteibaculaceae bacterium]|nr:arginine decarboxylase [Luteibaculaceae bacterium]